MNAVLKITNRPVLRPEFNNSALKDWDNYIGWYRANRFRLRRYWSDLGGGPRDEYREFVAVQFDRECMSVDRDDDWRYTERDRADDAYDAWAQRND